MIVINYTNYNIKNTTRKPSLIEVLFIKYSLALFSFSNFQLGPSRGSSTEDSRGSRLVEQASYIALAVHGSRKRPVP